MEKEAERKVRICVTGAGGYIASWLVKLLLSKGYIVHGTVRDPSDKRNSHLKKLDKAIEYLHIFEADLLDYNSVASAVAGCEGVFHVASPVPTSKVANPENWYCLSKTLAEGDALDYAEKHGLDVITLCPSMVIGPLLQSTLNGSSLFLLELFKGLESAENKIWPFVDVRDVADALLLVYQNAEAFGRYICSPHAVSIRDMVDILKRNYPNYDYPKEYIEEEGDGTVGHIGTLSSEKLKQLGWKCRTLEESAFDSVEYYQEAGILNKN